MLVLTDDAQERKEAEEALRRERNLLSAVLETAGAPVVVLDPQGRLARFNCACEETTDYAFEQVRDQPFWDLLLRPWDVVSVRAVTDRLCAGDLPSTHENVWLDRHGGHHLISRSNTTLLDAGGAAEYVVGAGIHVTERRRAEHAVRRAHDEPDLRVQRRTAELDEAYRELHADQRELLVNDLLRISMEEIPFAEQRDRPLDVIMAVPWRAAERQGAAFLADPDSHVLELRVHRRLEPLVRSTCARVTLGVCLCGRAAASGQVEFAASLDPRHEARLPDMVPHASSCVPVRAGGRVVAVLLLDVGAGYRREPEHDDSLEAIAHAPGRADRAQARRDPAGCDPGRPPPQRGAAAGVEQAFDRTGPARRAHRTRNRSRTGTLPSGPSASTAGAWCR